MSKSKMKHLLRKLHIGTDNNHNNRQHRPDRNQRTPSPSPSPTPSPSASGQSTAAGAEVSQVNRVVERTGNSGGDVDHHEFNFLEEEFQVQLALALSASDSVVTAKDVESEQIKAAKELSLGCSSDSGRSCDLLSLNYWNSNVIHYDEKVLDGFYDVYGIATNMILQGELPFLVDLQAIFLPQTTDYEVISVNRTADSKLRYLENKAYEISRECEVLGCGLAFVDLIQRVADLVVDQMGGPVGDAKEMMKRWRDTSNGLRNSLDSVVLPLGHLDVGLSRHRALLFKVLADRINLPCMLVKGSLYTGTDDGAVNLIKTNGGSEYIIDLMGAPGALIPAEVPSSVLLDSALVERGFPATNGSINELSLVPDEVPGVQETVPVVSEILEACFSGLDDATMGSQLKLLHNQTLAQSNSMKGSPRNAQYLVQSGCSTFEALMCLGEVTSLVKERKVEDVSKYVTSAAKNPEFVQKLHAVILESGASPPPDLFSDILPEVPTEKQLMELIESEKEIRDSCASFSLNEHLSVDSLKAVDGNRVKVLNGSECEEDASQTVMNTTKSSFASSSLHVECIDPIPAENISPMLGEIAEWEIPWEDLRIGDRIGIGSHGEVYRADWNGTEVAVKKFLLQNFTEDLLVQFRSEAELMIRLNHHNVVLFIGAVTRPPNLSILTEFLPRGSLYKLLHRSSVGIDEKMRMKMALDVARGMNYLHTSHPTIVHRDLKSPNLLVDKNWVVKVCDFGMSRTKHHTFLSSKSIAGTAEWMAPEVLRNEQSNEKCDVYSFGVILWELVTSCVPWMGLNSMQVVGAVGFKNERLQIPNEVDPVVSQIICDCWENDPTLRPSFSQLITRLRGLTCLVVPKYQA